VTTAPPLAVLALPLIACLLVPMRPTSP
jgi:hypothetical protein